MTAMNKTDICSRIDKLLILRVTEPVFLLSFKDCHLEKVQFFKLSLEQLSYLEMCNYLRCG